MKIYIIKFIYSEKATTFCEIFTLLLSYVVPVKSMVEILQKFVVFSEHMNFNSDLNDFEYSRYLKARKMAKRPNTFLKQQMIHQKKAMILSFFGGGRTRVWYYQEVVKPSHHKKHRCAWGKNSFFFTASRQVGFFSNLIFLTLHITLLLQNLTFYWECSRLSEKREKKTPHRLIEQKPDTTDLLNLPSAHCTLLQ